MVALFAEMATGLSYELLLYQLVFDPLHLRRNRHAAWVQHARAFVHGYDNNATGERDDISEALNMSHVGGGSANILAFDLNRFIRAYAGGKLFGGATRAARPTSCAAGVRAKGPGGTRRDGPLHTTLGAGPSTGTRATSPATPSP